MAGWLSGKNIVTLRPSFIPSGLDRSFLWAECDNNYCIIILYVLTTLTSAQPCPALLAKTDHFGLKIRIIWAHYDEF